jgi:exopolysaccharide biosynthesis WecB/TagA/CpsF family protein
MDFGRDPKENTQVIEFINDVSTPKQPTAVFLCTGAPKSEIWASDHLSHLRQGVVLPVGAAIDFAAGSRQRASATMQARGLEWFYRMLSEPGRLGPRYARNVLFLAHLGGALVSRTGY